MRCCNALSRFPAVAAVAAVAVALIPGRAAAVEPVAIYTHPEKQADGSMKGVIDSGNTAWMLTSTALVLMMTGPGLALFYGGLVRRKNVLSTMMHSFILMAVVSVVWAVAGYSLAFDAGTPFIGGLRFAFLREVGQAPSEYADSIPHSLWMAFQMMFAIITPALITGAYAERIRFSSMVVFSVAWLLLVYCPMAHMVWGKGGLLNAFNGGRISAIDFAGGTVVHIASGVSALVCALVLGRRAGFGAAPMPPHSVVLSVVGAALLWVGWFGFNAGSALSAGALAGSAFIATHFAAAAAALGWAGSEWIRTGKPTVLGAISGAVAGLVVVTPASGFVTPMAAIIMGLLGGTGCFLACTSLKQRFGYDDSLDAFGVHGTGGTMGALLTGVFASTAIGNIPPAYAAGSFGLIEGSMSLLTAQFFATIITWGLAAVGTLVILKVVDALMGLRVPESDEHAGLDLTQHGESGYNPGDAFAAAVAVPRSEAAAVSHPAQSAGSLSHA